ncbi:MAG: topoisomerase C-terminal repeat-containing protein, partial [Spirochaetaceae bacterium]|nr:topoisomerase C-terminal repeat-containing protein [Spirochaetaceae bacterium]
ITPDNKRLFNSAKLTDHHALIPLKALSEAAATEQRNVYSAVLKRFFTVIKDSHHFDAITVTSESNGFTLTGSGKTVTRWGWKECEKDTDDSDEAVSFPPLSEGETYTITDTAVLKKQTGPKKHFTHATLLALMENPKGESGLHPGTKLIGLGTPATRADIIDTLLKREYIQQSKQSLMITDKGRFLINTVTQLPALASFVSINTTTEWEKTLQQTPDQFVEDIKEFLKTTIPAISITARWEGDPVGSCPVCKKGKILKGKKNWYCSAYKKGCGFVIWNTVCGASLSASDVQALLSGEKTKSKKMKSSKGKEFSAQLILVNGKIEFVPVKK